MSDEPKRGAPLINCPDCQQPAQRVGAQDNCDVYLCPAGHVTRIPIGKPR